MLSIFSCASWPSVCLLWRNVSLSLLLIFWLGFLFFWYWAAWAVCRCYFCFCFVFVLLESSSGSIYFLDINPLPYIYGLRIFSLFLLLSCFLCHHRRILLWFSPTCLALLSLPLLFVSYPWNYCQDQCHEDPFLCFLLGVLQFGS